MKGQSCYSLKSRAVNPFNTFIKYEEPSTAVNGIPVRSPLFTDCKTPGIRNPVSNLERLMTQIEKNISTVLFFFYQKKYLGFQPKTYFFVLFNSKISPILKLLKYGVQRNVWRIEDRLAPQDHTMKWQNAGQNCK